MPLIQIATPFNIDIEFETAEFYKRLLAYLIDLSLIVIYLISMLYLLYGGIKIGDNGRGFVLIILFLPVLFYTLLSELWMNGQTVGKKIFKIKAISLGGGEPSLEQYLLRWFMRFYEWGFLSFFVFYENAAAGVLILFIAGIASMVIMAISKTHQRLGDIIAGTVVVNTQTKLSVHDTIFVDVREQGYKVKFPEVLRLSDRDINTIKGVLSAVQKNHHYEMVNRVATKIKEVLKISSDMYSMDFLEKILEDYNYLSTREM